MNKKVVSSILLIFILSALLININFTSAQGELTEGIKKIGGEITQTLAPILSFLFNLGEKDTNGNWIPLNATDISQTMLSFIFAFIIVFVFLLLAFRNLPLFDEHRGLSKFIIIIISLLGIRGIAQISPSVMSDIFMPYSVAALAIINGAVIVGWFMLVNIGMKGEQFKFVRRFMWILFAVIFVGIWGMRTFFSGEGEGITALMQWTYIVTIVLSLIMAFLDGSVQGAFAKMEADKINHVGKVQRRAAFKTQLKSWEDMVQDGTLSQKNFKTLEKDLQAKANILGLKGKL